MLLAQQSLTSQHTKPHSTDQDLKRDTPTAPAAISDSPECVLNKKTTANMVPQKLLDTLTGTTPIHQTPTRSHTLTSIHETAQGIMRNSWGQKSTNFSTSYAKGTTGDNKK
jgi:hypothetical protein